MNYPWSCSYTEINENIVIDRLIISLLSFLVVSIFNTTFDNQIAETNTTLVTEIARFMAIISLSLTFSLGLDESLTWTWLAWDSLDFQTCDSLSLWRISSFMPGSWRQLAATSCFCIAGNGLHPEHESASTHAASGMTRAALRCKSTLAWLVACRPAATRSTRL